MAETVLDSQGHVIDDGARVYILDFDDVVIPGTVTHISDPDGDVDEEGRSILIPVCVTVKFDDGGEDAFRTFWTGVYGDGADDGVWEAQDLTVC